MLLYTEGSCTYDFGEQLFSVIFIRLSGCRWNDEVVKRVEIGFESCLASLVARSSSFPNHMHQESITSSLIISFPVDQEPPNATKPRMNSARSSSLTSLDDAEWQTATIESSDEHILATSICSVGEYSCLTLSDHGSDHSIASSAASFAGDDDDDESDCDGASDCYHYEPQWHHERQWQNQRPRSSITSIATTCSILGQQALAYFNGSTHAKRLNRGVSFDQRYNEIYHIPNKHDLSKQDRKLIWYQQDELKRVRKENQRLVKLMDQAILFVDDDDMCYGLETDEDSRLRQRISESSVRRVCVEQEQCLDDDYEGEDSSPDTQSNNPDKSMEERLSTVYFESSFACQLEAHQRALQLERDIQEYVCPKSGRWGGESEAESSLSSIDMVGRRVSDGTQHLPMQPTRHDSLRSVNLGDDHHDDGHSSSSSSDESVATYCSDDSSIASEDSNLPIEVPTSPTLSLSSSSSSEDGSSSKRPPKLPQRRLAKTVEIWSPASVRM